MHLKREVLEPHSRPDSGDALRLKLSEDPCEVSAERALEIREQKNLYAPRARLRRCGLLRPGRELSEGDDKREEEAHLLCSVLTPACVTVCGGHSRGR